MPAVKKKTASTPDEVLDDYQHQRGGSKTHLVQHHHTHNVAHDEREGILGRHTEVLPVDGTVHIGIPTGMERWNKNLFSMLCVAKYQ